MNEPWDVTPTAVAMNLAQLARELASLTDGLEDLERKAVIAREDFTLAYSTAFLSAEGAVETRKHEATVLTHDERLRAETAEALVRGRRAQIASLKVRIDVGRSVGSIVKSELALDQVR